MRHLRTRPGSTSWSGVRTSAVRTLDEAGPEFLEEIKAYLDCRSRGVDPPPPLAEAWEGFYGS